MLKTWERSASGQRAFNGKAFGKIKATRLKLAAWKALVSTQNPDPTALCGGVSGWQLLPTAEKALIPPPCAVEFQVGSYSQHSNQRETPPRKAVASGESVLSL